MFLLFSCYTAAGVRTLDNGVYGIIFNIYFSEGTKVIEYII